MRTTNPTLSNRILEQAYAGPAGETMSVQGVVNKSFMLFFLLAISAWWVWGQVIVPKPTFGEEAVPVSLKVGIFVIAGASGGLILALVTVFKMAWARVTAPLYAVCEGLFLGGISAVFEQYYPGIVLQAVGFTFATLFCLLMAYKTGFVKVTDKFRLGVVAATGAVALVYIVNMVIGFFGMGLPFLTANTPLGIGISLVIVGIAALNLVLDFDLIDRLAQSNAPRYMEWYGAFALMVTLVWLYLEILRLLAKLRDRR